MRTCSLSLKSQLIFGFVIVIFIGSVLFFGTGSRLIKTTILDQAQTKVRHDLASAWLVLNEKLNNIKIVVSLNAAREGVQGDIINDRRDILLEKLKRVKEKYDLDILTLTDSKGKVVLRMCNPGVSGDDQSRDEIVSQALNGVVAGAPEIIPRAELVKECENLTDRAYIKFIETPKASFRPEDEETSGMMLKAAAPVIDDKGRLLGVLYGGVLLNRNYEIVDLIKEIVYQKEQYKGRDTGTATIFQQDLRITTNVRNEQNNRAIGTRVSAEVNEAVLRDGNSWIGRAFVVNDWYITAYEPIKDIKNRIIGMLYVGMLERPYIDKSNHILMLFSGLALLGVTILMMVLYFFISRITKPLQEMVVATQHISRGDLSQEIDVNSKDEIGLLADSFNRMTASLNEANKKLVDWGKSLEKKVKKRTSEVEEMQVQLVQSEKLASLGKLSASIAHEINNPLGAILVYSNLLLEDTDKSSPYYNNLSKIVKETTRCKDIIKGLLEFARPKDPDKRPVNVNDVLDKSLSIVENQALFHNISLKKLYSSPLPRILGDSNQLQQVFMNIIINAIEAMEGRGALAIATSLNADGKSVEINFTDNGPGISQADKERIFEPFFSTKNLGGGTGLGLAISYGIIQKHKGIIDVESKPGKGSTFTIKLPVVWD